MTSQAPAKPAEPAPLRDAATLILVRGGERPSVLMGQRGRAASFMPNKFVFPGGALDPEDAETPAASALDPACAMRLAKRAPPAPLGLAFANAAVRETFEETGLRIALPADAPALAGESWRDFSQGALLPAHAPLRYLFRAATPPGLPRRFDARFFLASVAAVHGDPDDFSAASGELSHLTWTPLRQARELELPFITSVVLAEVQSLLDDGWRPETDSAPPDRPVPFFRHEDGVSRFDAL